MCWSFSRVYGYTTKRVLIFIISLFFVNLTRAQDCSGFFSNYCISYQDEGYKVLPDSRSFSLSKGDSIQFSMNFYSGMDYHINIAVDDVFGQKLILKIVDLEADSVLYDNRTDEMNLNIDISIKKQIYASVKVYTITPKKISLHKIKGCVGILFENKPTLKTGF